MPNSTTRMMEAIEIASTLTKEPCLISVERAAVTEAKEHDDERRPKKPARPTWHEPRPRNVCITCSVVTRT